MIVQANPKQVSTLVPGEYAELPTRGISKETCIRYKYQQGHFTGYFNGDVVTNIRVHIANYCDEEGTPVAQKLRTRDKKFTFKGDASLATLFGQHLYRPNKDKPLIITEGEIDALTVSQVMGKEWAVVSIPKGTKDARKTIQSQMEYMIGFKEVLIGFDNDEAGNEAAAQCLELFDPTFAKKIVWTDNDANALLLKQKYEDIIKCINEAGASRPKSLVRASEVMDKILERPTVGVAWPWETLTRVMYGIHSKKIYTFGAGSGVGKTEVLLNIIHHLCNDQEEQVGGMFLETDVDELYRRLAGLMLGQRIHVPGAVWDEEKIKGALAKIDDRLIAYDISKEGARGTEWETIKAKLTYMVKGLGIKYVVLDHLTALTSHAKDERRELDKIMAELGVLVKSLDCTVFLVSHLSAPGEGLTYEEGRPVTPRSFRGSQSIQYWSAFMIGLERNKLSEEPEERLLTKVRILKDRFSGEADGMTMYLKYNTVTGKLEELRTDEGEI
jgi:twinkle protein